VAYEYDAYGNVHVLEPDFSADADNVSDYGNPIYFTGRRLDTLDNGDLEIYYYRHRFYDDYTSEVKSRLDKDEELIDRINENGKKSGVFAQYKCAQDKVFSWAEYLGALPVRQGKPEKTLSEVNFFV